MILNSAPENQAVLSNVGEIGEFRIRNSAKAFNILSSGLYANKIRAIVRELSCNAVDSHVAAGRGEVPFQVHIPNTLEPHFSIRDFGTGLNHDQVTNIYTTYFESTKTASNEFIGALGLGSKSPFSYTDNFTVTAIKDGRKGIYSAFINGEGVPSIALMMEEETDEPSGVEIKFSVNDRWDFDKFRSEAEYVYRYFKVLPEITGSTVNVTKPSYDTMDIISGVHIKVNDSRRNSSVAVMGNIAYPIEIPQADKTLGDLAYMLDCGLEMHFDIGELDFQASREGLSYIPQTIEAIKRKLTAVNDKLVERLTEEASVIPNLWDRAVFLSKKSSMTIWRSAVAKYATDNPIPTFSSSRYDRLAEFNIPLADIASKYNISVGAIYRSRGSRTIANVKPSSVYLKDDSGVGTYIECWKFAVDSNSQFVLNDTKVGAVERAKYHYRDIALNEYGQTIFVFSPVNKAVPMDTDGLFNEIHNPPKNRVLVASELKQKPRKDSSVGRNVTILKLEERTRGSWSRETHMVWADAGKVSSMDPTATYYYVPLSGFAFQSNYNVDDVKSLHRILTQCGIPKFANITIHGVRKTDLEEIKKLSNWVNLEDYIVASLVKPDESLMKGIVLNTVSSDHSSLISYRHVSARVSPTSDFAILMNKFAGISKVKINEHFMRKVYSYYGKNLSFDFDSFVKVYADEFSAVSKKYRLLDYSSSAPEDVVAEYINCIDNQKGV